MFVPHKCVQATLRSRPLCGQGHSAGPILLYSMKLFLPVTCNTIKHLIKAIDINKITKLVDSSSPVEFNHYCRIIL